jgi:hypothetical protein
MRVRTIIRRIVPVLLAMAAAQVQAQPSRELQPGVLLRVETPEGRFSGNLVGTPADSLILRASATRLVFRIPVRDVLHAEQGFGRAPLQQLVLKRGLQGGAIGFVVGALVGVYLQEDLNLKDVLLVSALAGAEAGAITGGLSALTERRQERWRTIQLPAATP